MMSKYKAVINSINRTGCCMDVKFYCIQCPFNTRCTGGNSLKLVEEYISRAKHSPSSLTNTPGAH